MYMYSCAILLDYHCYDSDHIKKWIQVVLLLFLLQELHAASGLDLVLHFSAPTQDVLLRASQQGQLRRRGREGEREGGREGGTQRGGGEERKWEGRIKTKGEEREEGREVKGATRHTYIYLRACTILHIVHTGTSLCRWRFFLWGSISMATQSKCRVSFSEFIPKEVAEDPVERTLAESGDDTDTDEELRNYK